jgi:hypothetical protein
MFLRTVFRGTFLAAILPSMMLALAAGGSGRSLASPSCGPGPVTLTGEIQLFDGRIFNQGTGPIPIPVPGARQKVVQLVTSGVMVPVAKGGTCIRAVTIHLAPASLDEEREMRLRFGQKVTVSAASIAARTETWQRGEAIATGVKLVR